MDRHQGNPEIHQQMQLFIVVRFYIALFIVLLTPTLSHSAIVARAVTNVGDTAIDKEEFQPEDKMPCAYLAVNSVGTCSSITTDDSCYEPYCDSCSNSVSAANAQHVITTTRRALEGRVTNCVRSCTCVNGSTTYSCASGYCGNPTSANSTVCKSIPEHGKCVNGVIQCNANYYKSNNLCVDCPANATCAGGTESFVCNSGYQKNSAGDACVSPCTSTEYFNGAECVACPDNASCDNETHTVMCNVNYYRAAFFATSPATTTYSCAACPKNATCAGGTATFKCNNGYYSTGRVMINGGGCTACPEGGTTDTIGATSVSACKMVDGGTYFDNTGSYTISGGGCTYGLTTAI